MAPPPNPKTTEIAIDEAFASNALLGLPFAQSAWTLLSVVEDHHFKNFVFAPLDATKAAMFADSLLNELTHPLRVCYLRGEKGAHPFERKLDNYHYELAQAWLTSAKSYQHFCSIFPLYHAGLIDLRVEGFDLIPDDWSGVDFRYEVYNRFIGRRDTNQEQPLNPNLIRHELISCMRVSGGVYSVDFNRRLVSQIKAAFQGKLLSRYTLPERWEFAGFSLAQFQVVFTLLQSMAFTWFAARQHAAANGTPGIAFASAVWTPRKTALVMLLSRHSGTAKSTVADILKYLTFGEMGIRQPDIAIQPLVDLTNGQYVVSPFVLTQVNAERNLCVLLNKIPSERTRYSRIVDEKEHHARSETTNFLSGLALDFRHGQIDDTDIDLAIIDQRTKTCFCIEIKWFIEPAEIREVLERSEELTEGIAQAFKITKAFNDNNARLMSLLGIDITYDFLVAVGSVNFIGNHRIQHVDVPILKLWHLTSQLQKQKRLDEILRWLRARSYLPRREDYRIVQFPIQSGDWHSRWYGIADA